MLVDLMAHAKVWNVGAVRDIFSQHLVTFATSYLSNRPDPVYMNLLLIGSLVTILTAIFLFFMLWRERSARKGAVA